MSKRRDPEAVIVEFFTTCPPEAAGTVYRVIRGILAARDLIGPTRKRPVLEITDLRSPAPRRRKSNGGADRADVVDVQE